MFPFLFNKAHLPSLVAQMRDMLSDAKHEMAHLNLLDSDEDGINIPQFTLRSNNPRLPYQTTTKDKKFDAFTSQNMQIIQLEC